MKTMAVNCFTNATLHVNNNIKAPLLPQFFSAFSKYHDQHRLLNYNIFKK